jgi:hypothetical protein
MTKRKAFKVRKLGYTEDLFPDYTLEEIVELYLQEGKSLEEAQRLAENYHIWQEKDMVYQRKLTKKMEQEVALRGAFVSLEDD